MLRSLPLFSAVRCEQIVQRCVIFAQIASCERVPRVRLQAGVGIIRHAHVVLAHDEKALRGREVVVGVGRILVRSYLVPLRSERLIGELVVT